MMKSDILGSASAKKWQSSTPGFISSKMKPERIVSDLTEPLIGG